MPDETPLSIILDERRIPPAVKMVPLTDLHSADWNPRTITDPDFQELCRSIRSDPLFLWFRPILAQGDGTIYAGNRRFEACLHLGWDGAPAIVEDVPDVVARERALRDNNNAGRWDERLLQETVNFIASANGSDAVGFRAGELSSLLAPSMAPKEKPEAAGETLARADEIQAEWGTALGDVWVVHSRSMPGAIHRLVIGDARDLDTYSPLIAGGRPSMIWTDPPYGVSYEGKTKDALTIEGDAGVGDLAGLLTDVLFILARDCVDSAPFYVCHPAGRISLIFGQELERAGYRIHQTLVWVKDAIVLGHSDMHYQHEPIAYGQTPRRKPAKGPAGGYAEDHAPIYYGWAPGAGGAGRGHTSTRWFGGNDASSVFVVPRPKASELHPTMKPPDLIARHIGNSSPAGAIVIDPFLGSGSTMIAAEQTARIGYGIELSPTYAAVALHRLSLMGLRCERTSQL